MEPGSRSISGQMAYCFIHSLMHLYFHIHHNKQMVNRRLDYGRIMIKDKMVSHTLLPPSSGPSLTGTSIILQILHLRALDALGEPLPSVFLECSFLSCYTMSPVPHILLPPGGTTFSLSQAHCLYWSFAWQLFMYLSLPRMSVSSLIVIVHPAFIISMMALYMITAQYLLVEWIHMCEHVKFQLMYSLPIVLNFCYIMQICKIYEYSLAFFLTPRDFYNLV